MDDKENKQPRYERREREKSAKAKMAEKQAAEKGEKKRKKIIKGKQPHYCKSCSKVIPGNTANNNVCIKCNEPLHFRCASLIKRGDCYCGECLSTISWDTVEDFDTEDIGVPRNARFSRSAAQIEKNRLRALKSLEDKAREKQLQQQQEEQLNKRNDELVRQLQELKIQCVPLVKLKKPVDKLIAEVEKDIELLTAKLPLSPQNPGQIPDEDS